MITKNQLKLGKLACKDETRIALQAIHFSASEKTATVTDGHKLIMVESLEHENQTDVEPTEPVLIGMKDAEMAVKLMGKDYDSALVKEGSLSIDGNGLSAPLAKQDGRFPDFKQVIPDFSPETKIEFSLDANILKQVCDYIVQTKDSRFDRCQVKFTIDSANPKMSPIQLETLSNTKQKTTAVIMPMRF